VADKKKVPKPGEHQFSINSINNPLGGLVLRRPRTQGNGRVFFRGKVVHPTNSDPELFATSMDAKGSHDGPEHSPPRIKAQASETSGEEPVSSEAERKPRPATKPKVQGLIQTWSYYTKRKTDTKS